MQIKFNINEIDVSAEIDPKSLQSLYELSPIARADILRDMLFDVNNLGDYTLASGVSSGGIGGVWNESNYTLAFGLVQLAFGFPGAWL